MVDYAVLAALLKNGQFLTKAQQKELEKELARCIESMRNKVLSCCALKAQK
jgi:hypothetical protein